jgi:hypothetical protein
MSELRWRTKELEKSSREKWKRKRTRKRKKMSIVSSFYFFFGVKYHQLSIFSYIMIDENDTIIAKLSVKNIQVKIGFSQVLADGILTYRDCMSRYYSMIYNRFDTYCQANNMLLKLGCLKIGLNYF